ncbi:MAG: hypothetical protein QG556_376 [Pseudomonadota bacterium]|nr:hypothetical protein [Pseudomonadota bacterium]
MDNLTIKKFIEDFYYDKTLITYPLYKQINYAAGVKEDSKSDSDFDAEKSDYIDCIKKVKLTVEDARQKVDAVENFDFMTKVDLSNSKTGEEADQLIISHFKNYIDLDDDLILQLYVLVNSREEIHGKDN